MNRELDTIKNHWLDEKTRGLAAIELIQKHKIRIYAESFDMPDILALFYHADHLAHVSVEVFVGRILKSIDNKKLYCKHKWYLEIIDG